MGDALILAQTGIAPGGGSDGHWRNKDLLSVGSLVEALLEDWQYRTIKIRESDMKSTAGKSRIIREPVKDKHTSHWDMDMLSRAELEALMVTNKRTAEDTPQDPESTSDTAHR